MSHCTQISCFLLFVKIETVKSNQLVYRIWLMLCQLAQYQKLEQQIITIKIMRQRKEKGIQIDKGSFAKIYLKCQGELKTVLKRVAINQQMPIHIGFTESCMLSVCCHPNIIEYCRSYKESSSSYVIEMEHISFGSLEHYRIFNDFSLLFDWLFQICEGLQYLHQRGIIHRDIKLSNLMVTEDRTIKIIDFGVSAYRWMLALDQNQIIGTPCFMAPQMFLKKKYDQKIDIYSLGVCIYMLAYCRKPFKGNNSNDYWQSTMKDQIEFEQTSPPLLVFLMRRMLQKNPQRRISIQEILNYRLAPITSFGIIKDDQ